MRQIIALSLYCAAGSKVLPLEHVMVLLPKELPL